MTYRDLIQGALQDLQIVGAGDVMSADDAELGLDRLNDWIDGLALEGLTMPTLVRVTWPLVPGLARYVIGLDSLPPDIRAPKPVSPQAISNIGYVDTTSPTPVEILFGGTLSDAGYRATAQKTQTQAAPTSFWYDPLPDTTGLLYPLPIPTRPTLTGVLYMPGLLTEVALTDVVALGAGYRRLLRSNLTVELAAAFEKPVPPSILRIASEAMMRVKSANLRLADLGMDSAVPGVGGGAAYDIRTDA